ncbi:MORN repeat-containing protein 4 [Salpingoeca rosetta]|uniref:MORN repeat-containing protein 4 n=1 Tax=Salpingoeca rosetta (strain ATCC 50818 / BSB-021) TaxID=946362 RepID=F2UGS8_SALR5|nr:MORN repeat-containing protein 4 [Salpingoeca rosetta]EGD75828.1 MORN repeat-containing protein 4 [Salpingoeca rosetta]|eukprot:XP_004991749.1 MORN repeat-containing protein 4 [Salpingoeca rosetta]
MAEGIHEVKYDDGDIYKGHWNGDGKRDGLGVLKFADDTTYKGEFSNGMNSGYGVLTFADGSKYEGQFSDGKYHGYGVFSGKDGMKYEGEFNDGKANGAGKVTFPDGSPGRPRQEGTFQDRKLVTGGKQAAAVRQAQDAQQMAQQKASEAAALK